MVSAIATANEQLGRDVYAAFSRGDLGALLGMCADEMTFTVQGNVPFAGTYPKTDFPALIGQVMTLSAGTFSEAIVDLLVSEHRVLAYLDHKLQRNGKAHQYFVSHMWTVKDGKFTSWRELPDSVAEFEAIWG